MEVGLVSDLVLEVMGLRDDRDQPINRRVYLALRQAILENHIPAGSRLPPTRLLAKLLAVGRNTVMRAYEQLLVEGYVEGQVGAGTFVTDTLPDRPPQSRRRLTDTGPAPVGSLLSARGQGVIGHPDSSRIQRGAFVPGVPDVDQFPFDTWRRLIAKHLRRGQAHLLHYAVGGSPALKTALAEYLRTSRHLVCDPQQILVVNGSHEALDLCARMLADPGDPVMMEEPGYWGARNVFRAAGLRLDPVPVDGDGLVLAEAHRQRQPRLIFLTPSCQYPTGVILSLTRRRQLLELAAERGAWIIEDDYDNELRYHKHPLAPLFGLSDADRVIYLGTFSKVMFPGLRLAYLVVPHSLVEPMSIGIAELFREGRLVEQAALAEFIADGHFASHIRRMRVAYTERQAILRHTLEDRLAGALTLSGGHAGINLLYYLSAPLDDEQVVAEALAAGVVSRPLAPYYLEPAVRRHGLVLGYAAVPTERIAPAARRLAEVIERQLAPGGTNRISEASQRQVEAAQGIRPGV